MLFSKDIRKACLYCTHAADFNDEDVLCDKHGPVPCTYRCRRFKYDPLRRVPAAPAVLRTDIPEESFKL